MTHPWWFRKPEEGPESPKSSVRRFRPAQSSRSERRRTSGCAAEAGCTLGGSQADEPRASDAFDGQSDGRAFRWRCCCGDDRFHRIREAPSLHAAEVGLLQNGEEFDVIEQSLGWVQHARGWSIIHVDGKQALQCMRQRKVRKVVPVKSSSTKPPRKTYMV